MKLHAGSKKKSKQTSRHESGAAKRPRSDVVSLEKKRSRLLSRAALEPHFFSNVDEGVLHECSFCDMPMKICLCYPGYFCQRVYRSDTLLEEIETDLRHLERFGAR